MMPPTLAARETVCEQCFVDVWTNELNDTFAEIARYYHRANEIATPGLWSTVLTCEPTLDVHAMDGITGLYRAVTPASIRCASFRDQIIIHAN